LDPVLYLFDNYIWYLRTVNSTLGLVIILDEADGTPR
jgi:hypothetical protein